MIRYKERYERQDIQVAQAAAFSILPRPGRFLHINIGQRLQRQIFIIHVAFTDVTVDESLHLGAKARRSVVHRAEEYRY